VKRYGAAGACVLAGAALITAAPTLHDASDLTWAVFPMRLVGICLFLVAVALLVLGVSDWLRGRGRRRLAGEIAPAAAMPALGSDSVIRALQGLAERGRQLLWEVSSGPFVRPVAEKAERWYAEVQQALPIDQRDRFVKEPGPFRTGSSSDIAGTLRAHIGALEQITSDMCYVPPRPSVAHMSDLLARLRAPHS
jgi:hypothetical protein